MSDKEHKELRLYRDGGQTFLAKCIGHGRDSAKYSIHVGGVTVNLWVPHKQCAYFRCKETRRATLTLSRMWVAKVVELAGQRATHA